MRPFRFVDLVADRTTSGLRAGSLGSGRVGPERVARIAFAVGAVTLALGAATVHAGILVRLSEFGSQGSGVGQFQTPVGVAVAPTSGNVFVADSGNARVQKFDPNGNFVSAWGWGVTDSM